MADQHVYLHQAIALGAGARGTLTFGPTDGVRYTIRGFNWVSTGPFSIIDIRDSAGNHYLADQTGIGIPSAMFTKTDFTAQDMQKFEPNIILEAGGFLYMDVVDTMGGPNAINVAMPATKSV